MPLTPAEVHNVAFKKPPIGKRGYDEEEVDAFLDIVEVELSRLIEENNDLRARAGAGGNGAGPGMVSDNGQVHALTNQLSATRDENQRMQSHIAELERALSQGNDGAQKQVVALQQQLMQTEQQLAESRSKLEQAQWALADAQKRAVSPEGGAPMDHHVQAVQVLALAQQTADQHLAQSKAEAERLIAEATNHSQETLSSAKQQAEAHLTEAQNRAKQLDEDSTARANRTLQEAEQRAAGLTSHLEQRKVALERRVDELRTFEREYRTRLKSYLESQLRDLDASDASGSAENAANEQMANAQRG